MKGLEKGKYTGIATIMLAILAIGSLLPMMAEAEETGYVRGSVYDSATQKLLEGAVVFTDEIQGIWKTDAKGTFLIEDMPYGIYNLTVYKEGYNTSHKEITLNRDTNGTLYDFSLEPALPTEIGVLTGKVYLEAEFHTISGDYTAGDAIVGFESGAQVPTGTIIDIIESTSDTLIGKYTTIVSPGTYNLFCWAYSHNEEHSGGLSVSAGEVVRHDFHLDALDMHNSGLAGNITDETSGVPIPGATVMAYNTATGNTLTTTADSSGFYFFTGPLPGDYIVVATVSSYNANSNTGTVVWGLTTYVDIALNTSNPDIITTTLLGFVFGDGTPLPGATVFTDYYFTQTTNVFGIPGFYLIGDFPGDEIHSVGATAAGYYPQLDAINVPSGTVERHDFYLQSTGDDDPKYTVVLANVWEDTNSSTPL
ncbi:MAG: carboxypeptidase regulatory-like domain-containing protein, partial [Candidatus Thermoplasmatota archaeon]|nr:carboxypeptidase regulatory-like domain-containing protein [Candidatus Thermoplasmatota archaeon]